MSEQKHINTIVSNDKNSINEDSGVGIRLLRKMNNKIEKIVYSLWTKPSGNIMENAVNWYSPKAHLLCLALSVLKSKEHFKEVELVTDSEGWEIIKQLELPFTSVRLILDDIPKHQYGFWALGKIYAYKAQDKPFVHLDNDAILWYGLPDWALKSEVFVQNTEDEGWFEGSYVPEINHANKVLKSFPKNWEITREAFCTGIFGGCDIEFIQEYCDEALKFLNDRSNQDGWDSITNKGSYCIIFEQYILACLCHYRNKEVTYFDRYLNKQNLEILGYTHLWGAKKEQAIEKLLEDSLDKNYPGAKEKVNKLF
ncbi:MAG: hypothetical protein QM564_11955 [Bergeyella sp.]